MIDVPLLPLTTGYMPTLNERDYRQMNPSGFETQQLRKKYMHELTIQRLTQNFQLVSSNGSIAVSVDPKYTINMSLCELYYQIKNMKSNLYAPKNELLLRDKQMELNYLYYDCMLDSFIPKYTKCVLMDPTSIQNFNDDYQNDFQYRDLLSVIFPIQKYVIFYPKKDMKLLESAW